MHGLRFLFRPGFSTARVGLGALLPLMLIAGCGHQPSDSKNAKSAPFDVIIRNGMVHDGFAGAPKLADVGIVGDRITEVGPLRAAKAKLSIDATGKLVTPGFINVLSWAANSLLVDGRAQSDVRQGVTLEVFGEGWSEGPLNFQMKQQLEKDMTEENRVAIEWTTLGEFLDYLVKRGTSVNVASFVGAATVRIHVLGYENRAPNAEELKKMESLVEQAMHEGALGVGSSLIYAPAAYAQTDELVAMMTIAGQYGGSYISHLRSEGDRFLESLDELIEIAKRSKAAAQVYHLKAAGQSNWPKMAQAIETIKGARREGIEISANMYAYTAGATGLDAAMPTWVQEGGYEQWRRRLQDPATRAKVIAEMRDPAAKFENLRLMAGSGERVLLMGFKNKALRGYIGKTLAEVAKARGSSEEDTVIDLVIEDGSRVETAYFLMSEDNVRLGLSQPWVSLGSDAEAIAPEGHFLKANPHPRAYGNFARFLERYVANEKIVPLPMAIFKLTGLPAAQLRLHQRGCLQVGCHADVNVFTLENIREHTSFADPHRFSTGMDYVLVNGQLVIKQGEHTGAKPGQVVRGPGYRPKAQLTN